MVLLFTGAKLLLLNETKEPQIVQLVHYILYIGVCHYMIVSFSNLNNLNNYLSLYVNYITYFCLQVYKFINNNMEKKKVIAIGDVHGLKHWKTIVGSSHNKDTKFVFLGDYIDPYEDICIEDLLSNFADIISFKKSRADEVVLLLGNHDMHYLYPEFPTGSRYNPFIEESFKQLLEDNRHLFQFAYQEGRTLYTHAGITNSWWEEDFMPHVDKSELSYTDGILNIADLINNADDKQLKVLSQVGYSRGGYNANGGIFWEDKYNTSLDPLRGFSQVVGHSRVPHVMTYNIDEDTHITFCDCLFNGAYAIQDVTTRHIQQNVITG